MGDLADYRRCGQCGRRFTKWAWRRNEYWCPRCEKYVCFSCQIIEYICPACGGKLNQFATQAYVFLLIFGGVFFTFGFIVGIIELFQHPFVTGMLLFSIIIFLAAYSMHGVINEQIKQHIKHISDFPKGMIPKKDRKNYGKSVEVSLNINTKMKRDFLLDESYFQGLNGDWTAPVLTKDQRLEAFWKMKRMILPSGVGLLVCGIVIFITQSMFALSYSLNIASLFLITFGLLFLFLVTSAGLKIGGDGPIEIYIPVKSIKLKVIRSTIEDYLEKSGDKFQSQIIDKTQAPTYMFPRYRYNFENGNYVYFVNRFADTQKGANFLALGYTYPNFIHAKDLQRDLDKILVENDIVYTFR